MVPTVSIMTRSLLLVSLAAGSLTAPVPASPAATELAIRAITVRPAEPVVGAHDSVRLVIDVIARGARGKNGVTVKVEPGTPPGPLLAAKPPVVDAPPWPISPVPSATPASPPATAALQAPPSDPSPAPTPAAQEPALPLLEPPQPLPVAADPKEDVVPPRLVWRMAAPSAARMTGAWQTWRFLPDKKLNRFYPTGTWTITATASGADGATVTEYASFQLRRATKLSTVRVDKAPKANDAVRLRGSLTRIDPGGYTDFGPFAKQRLEIQWRDKASPTWEKIAETTTDAAGSFIERVPPRTGGHWRIHYPGTAHYAPFTTKPRQIA
jgi:hypothetical protein